MAEPWEPGEGGDTIAPSALVRLSANPIQSGGVADYAHHITPAPPPRISRPSYGPVWVRFWNGKGFSCTGTKGQAQNLDRFDANLPLIHNFLM